MNIYDRITYFVSRVNHATKEVARVTGRGVATGAGTGFTLQYVLPKVTMAVWGDPQILPIWAVLGGSLVAVAGVEGGFLLFGRNKDFTFEQAARELRRNGEVLLSSAEHLEATAYKFGWDPETLRGYAQDLSRATADNVRDGEDGEDRRGATA